MYAGRCQNIVECSRRIMLDLATWVAHGYGDLPLKRLAAAYACGRPERCGLELAAVYPDGVPLLSLLQTSDEIDLELTCLCCGWCRAWPVGRLIERVVTGHVGPNTSSNTIGPRAICPKCKAREFEAVIRRPRAQGQG